MKKITFGGIDFFGRKTQTPYPTDEKYVLLSYFLEDIHYTVNETIKDLESVYKGDKSFEEIKEHPQVEWDFGEGSGILVCDQKTAYFTSEVSNLPSMELPLKELIDILYEWKVFLGK